MMGFAPTSLTVSRHSRPSTWKPYRCTACLAQILGTAEESASWWHQHAPNGVCKRIMRKGSLEAVPE